MQQDYFLKFFLEKLAKIFSNGWVASFLILILTLGIFVNDRDQKAYTLQHAGVLTIAERGSFNLQDLDVSELNHIGDTFHYQGNLLPAKQPGQFVIGAIPYAFLAYTTNLTYKSNYTLTAVLVSWGSSCLLLALAAILLFRLLHCHWKHSWQASLLAILAFVFMSPALAYSGVTHHDSIATSLLVIAFYLLETAKNYRFKIYRLVFGSFLLGLVIFISMLPAIITGLILGYYLFAQLLNKNQGSKLTTLAALCYGFIMGLTPLLIYNNHYFGNPFIQANIIGNYQDTFFKISLINFQNKLNDYFGIGVISLLKHSPILYIGLIGIVVSLFTNFRKKSAVILTLLIGHLSYILNIDTLGHCQVGPRYLLPVLPLFAVGLVFIIEAFTARFWRISIWTICFITGLFSLANSMAGAIGGSMYCQLDRLPLLSYLADLQLIKNNNFPLAKICFWVLVAYIIYLTRKLITSTLTHQTAIRIKKFLIGTSSKEESLLSKSKYSWIMTLALPLLIGGIYYFANPHFSSPYDYTRRIAVQLLNGETGLDQHPGHYLNEFVPLNQKFYSVFPLGAVLTMLPLATYNHFFDNNQNPTSVIVALTAFFSSLFIILICQAAKRRFSEQILLCLMLMLGSWLLTNLTYGGSWQLALGFAFLGELGAIYFSVYKKNPLYCGLFFSIAYGNRTELILCGPIFLYLLIGIHTQLNWGKLKSILAFCLFPTILAIITLLYNYERFGSVLDFGYARIPGILEEPWYQEGIFSLSAFPENFRQMFFNTWKMIVTFPFATPTGFGGSIFLASPFLVILALPGTFTGNIAKTAWFAMLIITAVLFTHGNPGGWQFSYRYAIPLLPWILVVLNENKQLLSLRSITIFTTLSIIINLYATWLFHWTNYVQP